MTKDLNTLVEQAELMPEKWLELGSSFELSDIHITPNKNGYELGVRKHSQLKQIGSICTQTGRKLIQRLKSAAKMNIADSRSPQDGRIQSKWLEARLATHPSLHGEGISIRLFTTKSNLNLSELGIPENQLAQILVSANKQDGLTLISGPTGSGKTTLAHAILEHLGKDAGRIVTLEDPVEIENQNAVQTDLSRLPNLNFAQGLRSLMRQDPDTLFVGEVRDFETASLCLHAALTGHRVLATVHAPSPLGTISRMQELGISLNALLNSLNGVINLRLTHQQNLKQLKLHTELLNLTDLPKAELLDCNSLSQLDRLTRSRTPDSQHV